MTNGLTQSEKAKAFRALHERQEPFMKYASTIASATNLPVTADLENGVTISSFVNLPRWVLRGAEEEAERLAAFLGCRLSLAWNSLI